MRMAGIARAAACLCMLVAVDAVDLPTFLASNMVLPRAPAAAKIWGTATPGDAVVVTLSKAGVAGPPKRAVAAADGSWAVQLEPQEAGLGFSLTVADAQESKVLTNLAFGDLWLCSGQSNMQFSTNQDFEAEAYISHSANRRIRLATVAMVTAKEPQWNVTSKAHYVWSESKPEAFAPVGSMAFSYFSAACYFFGLKLFSQLGGSVPLGLVASDWGGQRVETFSSPDALADKTCGGTTGPSGVLQGTAEQEAEASDSQVASDAGPGPSELWNAMIHPLLNFTFTGAVWYQGEANAGDPKSYACRFPAMIADWRKKFGLPDLTFLFVLLAAYSQDYSEIRNAQMVALQLPRTGYASATDLGDPQSPYGSIHPRRKVEVGRRLALVAAHITYGKPVLGVGPEFNSVKREADGELLIDYKQGTANGLHSHPTADCDKFGPKLCCDQSPFETEVDGTWSRVNIWVLAGPTSVALRGNFSNATALRFNWEGYPQCTLYNGLGGPDDHKGIVAKPFKVEIPKLQSTRVEIMV